MMSHNSERMIKALTISTITLIGGTASIWLFYIMEYFIEGIIPNISKPPLTYFVHDGTTLIVSISMFTAVIVSTSFISNINIYSIISVVSILISSFIYAKIVSYKIAGIAKDDIELAVIIFPLVLSYILLFISILNKKKLFLRNSWLSKSRIKDENFSIFVSYAISGIKNSNRKQIEKEIQVITQTLKSLGYTKIFDAYNYFNLQHQEQAPSDAGQDDFSALEKTKNFILYYPTTVVSSSLIELGYAIRCAHNIIILTKKNNKLPFLMNGMPEINGKIHIMRYNNIQHAIMLLKENHKKYLTN